MSAVNARFNAILDSVNKPGRSIEYPKLPSGRPKYTAEIFGENVFTLKTLQNTLPKPVYAKFIQQIKVWRVF